MRWNVEGADAKTGEQHVYSVEANSAHEAEARARTKGLLVTAVHRSMLQNDGDVLNDAVARSIKKATIAGPPLIPETLRASPAAAPEYREIVKGSILNIYAWILQLIGMVCIGLAAAVPIVVLLRPDLRKEINLPTTIIFLVLTGLIYLAGGVLTKMYASLALAIRDIARNSFTR